MCGIIGYIGKENATPLLIEGLRRESYRGYDSSGIVVFEKETAHYVRTVGKLEKLEEAIAQNLFSGTVGLGHSRWATHGGVTQENAHPHTDCKDNFFLVHNGIIENYAGLKEKLEKEGHRFTSQTDTEVLPHLIEHFFKGNLEQAVKEVLKLVRGAYGIAVIAKQDPGKIVVARLSSPLVLSINGTGGFVASDPAALLSHSNKMVFLDDREVGVIAPDNFSVTDLQDRLKVKETTELDWTIEEAQKGGYAHFMLKEIMEEPEAIENTMRGRLLVQEGQIKLGGLSALEDRLREIEHLILLACGTAAHAARTGEYMLEEYGGISTEVDVGSEFRYRKPVLDKKTAIVCISQSGETADTLASLREMKQKGILALGITNVVGSTQSRETDAGIYTRSGPEIAVASTKAFVGQVTALAMLTVYLGRQRDMAFAMGKRIVSELSALPELARQALRQAPEVEKLARKYRDFKNFYYIGRKYNHPIAREGAHKLKEVAYVHAEGLRAGELKHCELALVDENFPTIAIATSDSVYEKMISNIQEIRARKGPVIALATEGNEEIKNIVDDVIYIPKTLEMLTPILSVIPLHLFAYYMGVALGRDIDKPKNLAKSVTVE